MKAALLIVGLLVASLLMIRSLNYSGVIESPLFRGAAQVQFAVGF